MVFSFFRKNKAGDDENALDRPTIKQPAVRTVSPATAPPAESPAPQESGFIDDGADTIILEEADSEVCSAVEEAAVFFANDRVEQAIASLDHCLHETADLLDIQPWLMLFELYQFSGNKAKFDELALEFVVRFERSAPIWQTAAAETKKVAASATGNSYIGFSSSLKGSSPQLARLRQMMDAGGPVRIDLAKLNDIELDGAASLAGIFKALRKRKKAVAVTGAVTAIGLLRQGLEANVSAEAYWLLLFELYQATGEQSAFEDLAIEYAVALEVSPPSWEPPVVPEEPLTGEAFLPPAEDEVAEEDVFSFEGVLAGAQESRLHQLVSFASGREHVIVDMSRVPRVDFIMVGLFTNTLMELRESGKKLVIRNANELIQALFNVMGINQYASVERKKMR